jgi:hypothetical protein
MKLKYKQFNVNYLSTENEINDFLTKENLNKDQIVFVGSEAGRFIILYEEGISSDEFLK